MHAPSSISLASALFAALAASSPIKRSLEPRAVWQPAVGASWDIVLSQELQVDAKAASLPGNVEIIDIDLFINTGNSFSSPDDSKIKALHAANKKVICYFSAGSYEPYRPDSSRFTAGDQGSGLDGWPDETWLNLKSENVANIMRDRIALAAKVGCDGIDPDNMDGYDNQNGMGLTKEDTVNYFKNVLAPAAQQHGLALGLKNSINIIPEVLPMTQFVVTEQCAEYGECDQYQPYIDAGKPVLQIEYPLGESSNARTISDGASGTFCAARAKSFSTVLKLLSLDNWTQTCGGGEASSPAVPTTTASPASPTTTGSPSSPTKTGSPSNGPSPTSVPSASPTPGNGSDEDEDKTGDGQDDDKSDDGKTDDDKSGNDKSEDDTSDDKEGGSGRGGRGGRRHRNRKHRDSRTRQ